LSKRWNVARLTSEISSSPRAAVQHAVLLGGAIQGAKILWVDPNPDHNRYERRILEDMGVSVQLAWSTEEALRFLEATVQDAIPDLVVSNITRTEEPEPTTSLSTCPSVYYDFPDKKNLRADLNRRADFKNDIWQFNAFEQIVPPAGFAMAESMAKKFPKHFGNHQRPRIIFYTAASGGIAADACARIITNRPDVLLENVVSALAEFRSAQLPDPCPPPKP
jgi:hypothetical protein